MKTNLLLIAWWCFHLTIAAQSFSGGTGSVEDPFLISTKTELLSIGQYPGFSYLLDANLDFKDDPTLTTSVIPDFNGNFDGNGHTISNVVFEGSISFFGTLDISAKVKNLHLRDFSFTALAYSNGSTNSKNQYHAPFAYTNNGLIENCSFEVSEVSEGSKVSVGSYSRVSGFVLTNAGSIKNCYANAIVDAYDAYNISYNTFPGRYGAGFVITNTATGVIENCFSAGTVSVGDYGAAGFVYDNVGMIKNSFSLVQSVRSTWYGYAVHRFANSSTGNLENVYALTTMTLNGSAITNTTSSSIEGVDVSAEMISLEKTYTDIGWDFNRNWKFEQSAIYPSPRVLVDCPTITLSSIPESVVRNYEFDIDVVATGGSAPYKFTVTQGDLPVGVGLSEGGRLSGTATDVETVNFTITAIDVNGCSGSVSYSVEVSPLTSLSVSAENDVLVRVNPLSGSIYLNSANQHLKKLKVYDTSGCMVFQKDINSFKSSFDISLTSGVYILYIELENKSLISKIVMY